MSLPVLSNIATFATTIMTSTVKTVAELHMKLLCMEQRWAQTSTSPLPEGIQKAVMGLPAALVVQEAVAVQPVEVPEWREADVNGGKMSEKEMESTKRGGEEQESTKEKKVEKVHHTR
jgi:hypothetical protein